MFAWANRRQGKWLTVVTIPRRGQPQVAKHSDLGILTCSELQIMHVTPDCYSNIAPSNLDM